MYYIYIYIYFFFFFPPSPFFSVVSSLFVVVSHLIPLLSFLWSFTTIHTLTSVVSHHVTITFATQHEASVEELLGKMAALSVNAAQELPKLEMQLIKEDTHFVDSEFPPVYDSIIADKSKPYGPFLTWRRAPEFMEDGKFSMFEDGIDPLDIEQGQLGNCWFCCALSCMAEHPQLVERMFLSTEPSEAGVYRLRICKDGMWEEVTVDDYFPCFPHQKPIFSINKGNELWVILAEKAYAKLHGSYHSLKAGKAVDAMADLTGYPSEYIDFNSDKVSWMILFLFSTCSFSSFFIFSLIVCHVPHLSPSLPILLSSYPLSLSHALTHRPLSLYI